ncbi:MAG: radical SAM protein [Clostridiales bacterium]|jgi:spore photoproduct lyase|nr:radical SAM protein [Clostridiales bacterium]
MSYNKLIYNKYFSHIYAEEDVWGYPAAQKIRAAFPDSVYIPIRHYKDVFCKKGQDFSLQKRGPKLILAVKRGAMYYKGSHMCDSFGRGGFIYTSEIMNCLYNCEYCYLRGMYPSANVVIFVNQEDCLSAVERVLPAYICVSYDTDLLAFEHLTAFVHGWMRFCGKHPAAEIEIRTKSAGFNQIENITPLPNVTLAWTISPDEAAARFENGAPPLAARLADVSEALDKGWTARVCVDPIIKFKGWREAYRETALIIKNTVGVERLSGVSVGAFRVSPGFYKRMRKLSPYSEVLSYPMVERDGGMRYPDEAEIVSYLSKLIHTHVNAPSITKSAPVVNALESPAKKIAMA